MYTSNLFDITPDFATKIKIIKAMNILVANGVSMSKMTVRAICDQANIGRTTFYRHFPSKFAALEWYGGYGADIGLKQIGRSLSWGEGQVRSLQFWEEIRELAASAASSKGYDSLPRFAARDREKTILETLKQANVEITQTLSFQVVAYVYMENRMVMRWFNGKLPLTASEVAEQLEKCVPSELYKALTCSIDNSN